MADKETLKIRFPSMETGDAGNAARNLQEEIEDELPTADVKIDKDNMDTMDFGSTLVVVLGTPAVIALAKGIAKWMARERSEIEIEIDSEKVRIKAAGTVNENVARIVEAINQAKPGLQ